MADRNNLVAGGAARPERVGRGPRHAYSSVMGWLRVGPHAVINVIFESRRVPLARLRGRLITALGICATALTLAGCASSRTRGLVPAGTSEPDRFLFEKGTASLNAKKWLTAREFFKQVNENYIQSVYRPDAKLGIGDTYLGEGSAEALVLAINEYKEFLSFYPTNRRADYAQYKLALCHFKQMRAPQRDQSETREAVKELETFVDRYPQSTLMDEGKTKLREARDRMSEADYLVGYFYYRSKWYPGAIDRFKSVLKQDASYTGRDAVYFYLADSLSKTKHEAEALPYLERLVQEFEQSQYLPVAQKRIEELKSQQAKGAQER
jgi:outer membrane protein assembly factor BamD